MHLPIQILRHSLGLAIFCALYFAGRLAVTDGQRWGRERTPKADSESAAGNFFLYGGRFFEVVAFVGGFIEAVAVMVLASGWLIDLVTGFGVAE